MRYAILVSYDGTNYGGWQIQPNCISVQQKLEEAAHGLFGRRVSVTASGRTDSGVHARGQVCHFDVETAVPAEKIADAFNSRLPEDIRVLASVAAPQGFDANRSAKKKTYCYRFYCAGRGRPLKDRYSVRVNGGVDFEKLRRSADFFLGEHDFKAYCKSRSAAKTTVRTVYSLEVRTFPEFRATDVEIYITGNGFLYNMVRTIAGTMLAYAQGSLAAEDIEKSLASGQRGLVGKTMPAKGLTLESVEYGFGLFKP